MLDTVTRDLLAAIEAWRPDPICLRAGDEHLTLAIRCFAAAGLSDAQVTGRVCDLIGVSLPEPPERCSAAVAIAQHLAVCGMREREIVLVLADLAGQLPAWPDDPDELIWIARGADRSENGDGR
jgi:hypothetical protein